MGHIGLVTEFYFRLRFWHYRHRHMILHRSTKFHPNRTNRGRVMMSYPYFNMAATTLQIYFRFRMCYGHSLKSRYMCIFADQISTRCLKSIHGRDIYTCGFQTSLGRGAYSDHPYHLYLLQLTSLLSSNCVSVSPK